MVFQMKVARDGKGRELKIPSAYDGSATAKKVRIFPAA